MLRFRSFRLSLGLRVLVLGLLALGMLMKPVLASVGGLHEFNHHLVGEAQTLTDHAGHPADQSQNEDRQDESGSDALHALMHFAHCCGQSSLASFPAIAIPAAPSETDRLLMPRPRALPQKLSLAPFRPPITV